ncbi:G-patch domain-containing protein [Plasmodiophora brassicae]|uniref:G-patch domain-containing protein n=1 Tax=Plasmodiophora brassicae TaxID=37360 RepID=A0A0G4IXT9_PLABS|nr:hypothetical protein PBRA_007834 [Plasmodiophora brassicae]SPR00224.1 unnamed protein product [Plasmodiophora brassicae]
MQDTADSVQDVWKDIAQRFPSDTATCPTSAPVEEDMADDFPMPPPSLSLEVKTAAATGGRWRRFRQRRSPAREPGAHGNVSFDVQQEQEIPSCNVGHRILRKMGWTAGSGLGHASSGMVTPISVTVRPGRSGIGFGSDPGHSIRSAECTDTPVPPET